MKEAKSDKNMMNPLIISTAAGVAIQKLKLMLFDKAIFLRTNINVPEIKEYLMQSAALVQAAKDAEGASNVS